MDRRTVIPCYSTHHTQARRYRGLWTDGQSYLDIAHTTLRPGDTEGYGQTDSHTLLQHTPHSGQEIQRAMDRRTVIPCYSTHHTQARRNRGLWTDGQSYLAIAHTTLRPGDTEGYGQTDSHTLLQHTPLSGQEKQRAMDRRTVIPCYSTPHTQVWRYRGLRTDGQSYLAIAHTTLRPGDTEGYGQTDSHTLLQHTPLSGQEKQRAMDRRTVIPCYSTHHTQAWRYRGLWTDGQSYLAIAHTTLRPGDTEGYGQTDSHTLLQHTPHSGQEKQRAMDRRTVIPCYSTHHTQARRYRGLWADGQSYLAIAHTTLRPGDTEGYGQTDSHTLLQHTPHSGLEIQRAMDRRTVIPCYSTHHSQAWRYRGLWTDGQSYLAIAHTTLRPGDTEGYGQTDSHTLLQHTHSGLEIQGYGQRQSYLAIAHTTLRPGETEGYGQTDSHTLLQHTPHSGLEIQRAMDRRTVIPCYSTHHTQAWRYRGLWTDGQSYLAIAHTTLSPGDTEGYGQTDSHTLLQHTPLSGLEIQRAMDRRTVIPCYSTHHTQAWRYRGLWTDGQSYLAIAHTTLRPGDTEGYGQTDSHTLLQHTPHSGLEIQRAMDRRTVIPCYSTHHTQAWRYRGLWTDGQSYLAIAHTTLRPGDTEGYGQTDSHTLLQHTPHSGLEIQRAMDRRTVIPCYSTHHTQAWRYRGLWTDGQSYLAIAHTTLRPGDTEGYGQTDSHTLLQHTPHSGLEIQRAMDRRTVIPCYSTHHTQAWRYRGLWTDGQSYLAIAHTTLRPGDTEGYGQTDSHTLLQHTPHSGMEIQRAMDRRTVIPCYSTHHTQAWRYRGLWTDGQSYLAIAHTTLRHGDTEGYGQTDSHTLLQHTPHSGMEIQRAMDRRTVIPCYSTHHTQAWRNRGLWTDGQSYLAIAHTTLRPGDTEGYGQTDSHTLLQHTPHSGMEIQRAMDRRTAIPCYGNCISP